MHLSSRDSLVAGLLFPAAALAAPALTPETVNISTTVNVPSGCPVNAGVPLEAYMSYSIEFSSFVDFAGNTSVPNTFSNNLLNNLGNLTGTKPYIRVGGNTQDFALFNATLGQAQVGIVVPSISPDFPYYLTIGLHSTSRSTHGQTQSLSMALIWRLMTLPAESLSLRPHSTPARPLKTASWHTGS